jgi:Zn-dependent alcohol dehydrogenase
MEHHVRGVIARSKRSPVEITTIVVPGPGPGDALVNVEASGVCHTDLHDAFVSETIGLDGVDEAFTRMQAGEVLRSVVVMS